jgi:hypothetical protein
MISAEAVALTSAITVAITKIADCLIKKYITSKKTVIDEKKQN